MSTADDCSPSYPRSVFLNRAKTIYAYFDDSVYGGNGFEILWKETTQMTDLEDRPRL